MFAVLDQSNPHYADTKISRKYSTVSKVWTETEDMSCCTIDSHETQNSNPQHARPPHTRAQVC